MRPTRPLLLALLLAAPLVALLPAAPASAHDELVSTSPASGSTLTAVPASVSLTFGEAVEPLGTAVVITDATGRRVGAPAEVDGPLVSAAVAPDVAPGPVTVSYRVVSADGHAVTGSFSFTLDLPSATADATEAPSTTASDLPLTVSASATDAELASDEAPTPSGATLLPWVVLGVLVLVGGVVLVVRSRRGGSGA